MLINIVLLLLLAGVPYYVFFEKTKMLGREGILLFSVALFILGLIASSLFEHTPSTAIITIAFVASLLSLYKAHYTTNFYKLAYYILFFNAPMLIMFHTRESLMYGISLLISLSGIYFMAKNYERNYGSANYQSVSGITLVTPYAGLFLTIYLTTLALYPPFPNAMFFLNGILSTETNLIWFLCVIVIFFGNFWIAMRVMAKTVFGKPNDKVHYIDLSPKERFLHLSIVAVLLVCSAIGLKELLS